MVCDEQGCALLTPDGKQRVVTLCGLWSMAMRAPRDARMASLIAWLHTAIQCRYLAGVREGACSTLNETVGSPFSLAICLSGLTLAQDVAVVVHVVAGIATSCKSLPKIFRICSNAHSFTQLCCTRPGGGWLLQRGVS